MPAVEHISAEYGIPIINKRISVTPIAMLLGACPDADPVDFAKALDAAGKKVGVNFVGGYTALVHKGFSAGDRRLIESIPRALAETDIVCSSVNIGATKAGLNMDAIKLMGEAVKKASELTATASASARQSWWCSATHPRTIPSWPVHSTAPVSPTVRSTSRFRPRRCARRAGKAAQGCSHRRGGGAGQAHRLQDHPRGPAGGQSGLQGSGRACGHHRPFAGPHPCCGRQRGQHSGRDGLETCGCCGTTACLALLNDAVKKGGVMASNHVGGLSGAFIPVSEDDGMIHAAECGCLTIEKLEP